MKPEDFEVFREVGEDRPLPADPLTRLAQGKQAVRRRKAVRGAAAALVAVGMLGGGIAMATSMQKGQPLSIADPGPAYAGSTLVADAKQCARLSPADREELAFYRSTLRWVFVLGRTTGPQAGTEKGAEMSGTTYLQYDLQSPEYADNSSLLQKPFSDSLAQCLASGGIKGVPRMTLVRGFGDPALRTTFEDGFARITDGQLLTMTRLREESTSGKTGVAWQFSTRAFATRQYSPAEYAQVRASASGVIRWGADTYFTTDQNGVVVSKGEAKSERAFSQTAEEVVRGFAPNATAAPGEGPWPTSYPNVRGSWPTGGPVGTQPHPYEPSRQASGLPSR